MVFVDLEKAYDRDKAYDRIPTEVLWWMLEKKHVSFRYINVIKDTHGRATSCVRTIGSNTA